VIIRVSLSVDVDEESWSIDYSMPKSNVRADVRDQLTQMVDSYLRELGLGEVR
jgi:hypothetical protein